MAGAAQAQMVIEASTQDAAASDFQIAVTGGKKYSNAIQLDGARIETLQLACSTIVHGNCP